MVVVCGQGVCFENVKELHYNFTEQERNNFNFH